VADLVRVAPVQQARRFPCGAVVPKGERADRHVGWSPRGIARVTDRVPDALFVVGEQPQPHGGELVCRRLTDVQTIEVATETERQPPDAAQVGSLQPVGAAVVNLLPVSSVIAAE
jgi:hypothetical protein